MMTDLLKINPDDAELLADIQAAGAKGYSPDQVAVYLNLPFGPFMYAVMREPAVRHAWELGVLQYQTKFLQVAEEIAMVPGKQQLAGAIYCHRHAVDVQRRAQMLRPENNGLTMSETLKIEEIVSPEVMKIAMDDYKERKKNGQD